MTKKAKTIFRYIFFLGLGVFFIVWTLHELTVTDKRHISTALSQGKFGYLLPGFLILLVSHWIRALRWRLLIEPLGYKPSKLNTFFALMAGYLANQAVPRLGELLRCSVLTRYEKIPFDKLVGTVILERIIDAICLLLLFIVAFTTQSHLHKNSIRSFFSNLFNRYLSQPQLWLGIALAGIILVIGIWLWIKKKKAHHRSTFFKKIVLHVWQGLISIKKLRRPGEFIFLSIILWSLYAACVYVSFFMFQETLKYGWTEALTVLCAGSLGMIATPGGIGAYAFIVQKIMMLYELNSAIGLALGWLLWLLQTAVVLLTGSLSLLALPMYNRKKN